eukprot:Blabericola_migrator_1__822@NODE_1201_length_5128_cov_115_219917_g813_i0_p2_GENE_NODE_1201_length_5128_cov_115_219917_g813_i0NODE_1201_length_5128_cov_115_219917_g813_i0_p2_ORF_typecomplete_len198_score37_84RBDFIP/PF09457_10/0_097RBDFIP/PF09457_10/6_6e03_NODE_1201_length_5128_cov_115_219917_g813_i039834576
MSVRAAHIIAQQAQQQTRSQHDTKARLLFTGLVMGLTKPVGLEGGGNPNGCEPRLWKTDVFDYRDFSVSDGRRYRTYLIKKGILELDESKQEMVLDESTLTCIRDLEDLVILNKFLDSIIAKVMEKAPQAQGSGMEWHIWAADLLPQCEQQVRNSSNKAIAVARLRELVAIKSKLFQSPKLSPSEADALKHRCENFV